MSLFADTEQQPFDDEEYSCFFNTYVTHDGDICFSCGWGDNESDLNNLATLISKLVSGKIVPMALKNLREQCVDDDKRKDLDNLMLKLSTDTDTEGPLIPPTQASP